jgi:probable O-glycosylation ligase (exosortase A-associated)
MTVYLAWVLFAILAALAVARPWIGVVAYMGYVTLGPDSHYGFLIAPLLSTQRIIGAALIAGLLLNPPPPFRLTPSGKWAIRSLTAFVIVALASVVDSLYPEKSWWFWDHLWKIWLFVLLAVRLLDTPGKIQAAVWMIVFAQAFNAALVNNEYFGLGFSATAEAGRHALDNNTYGLSTLPPMAFAAALAIYCKPIWQRALAGAVLALEVHQMLLLDSRGGMASMVGMFLLGLILMPKRFDTLAGAAVVIALGLALAGPQVVKRFQSIFVEEKKLDESAQSRFQLWQAGWRIMNAYPVIGCGLFAGERLVPKFSPFKDEKEKAIHNLALDIGAGTGFTGIAFYLAFFGFGWWCAVKLLFLQRRLPTWAGTVALGTTVGLPAYWFGSMFSSSALIEAPYLMVTLAVCAFAVAKRRQYEFGEVVEDEARLPVVDDDAQSTLERRPW